MAADILARIRARRPRVHCITNSVAQNYTANMLLAAGAVPSMTTEPAEIASSRLRRRAPGQSRHLRRGAAGRRRGRRGSAAAAHAVGARPGVRRPLAVARGFRQELAARQPDVMRLNDAEFSALAGAQPAPATLERYALERATVVGLTGEPDLVTDGTRTARSATAHPLMAKVTAMGCAASALVAACLAVEPDAWRATAAGADR